MGLIKPNYGEDNCQHLKSLRGLKKVMNQTKRRKIGSGKKSTWVDVLKYNNLGDESVRKNINESIEYYEKLCSVNIEFRPYQKKIIKKANLVLMESPASNFRITRAESTINGIIRIMMYNPIHTSIPVRIASNSPSPGIKLWTHGFRNIPYTIITGINKNGTYLATFFVPSSKIKSNENI